VTTPTNGTRPHLAPVPQEPPPEDGIDTRPPPNDVPAEQAVLGAMMLSRQAILDAVEILQPHDFYRPPHEWIWDAIITMHTAGDPVDAVTVSDHLTSTGQLAKVGGAPYLHTLISTVPVAANAGHRQHVAARRPDPLPVRRTDRHRGPVTARPLRRRVPALPRRRPLDLW
jgi:replicative DNA helicase